MKNENTLNELAQLFLSLSDRTRLRLLALMSDGEVSVGFLADSLGESQPKVSRHLAYLRNVGLVSTRRDGKHVYYLIERQHNEAIAYMLQTAIGVIAGGMTGTFTENTNTFASVDNTYAEPYTNDYRSNELEVFLL